MKLFTTPKPQPPSAYDRPCPWRHPAAAAAITTHDEKKRQARVGDSFVCMMYESKTSSEALRRVFRPLVFKEQMNQLSVYTRPCCRPLARSSWSSGWPSVLPSRCVSHYLPCTRFASSEHPRLFTCVRWTRVRLRLLISPARAHDFVP